jgi:hypothetical protein
MGLRIARADTSLTERWRQIPVEPPGATRIGISFRPLQGEGFGLEPHATLASLLDHPYELVRLAAVWNRMEPAPDDFDPAPLDWQVEALARESGSTLDAYLFWGAEYWLLRQRAGDESYLGAFQRILAVRAAAPPPTVMK